MNVFGLTVSPVIVWVGVTVIFLIIEAISFGLTTIWFAAGAIVASVLALLGAPFALQIGVFLVVSVVLLYFTKPIAEKKLKIGREKTNINALIEKEGIVVEEITPFSTGQVKIDGQIWTAVAQDNDVSIPKGDKVIIRQIQGVKLVVTKNAVQ